MTTDKNSDKAIHIQHEVVGSITEGRDIKADWLNQARIFLDNFEKDDSLTMTSGVLSICGHENVEQTFTPGTSERHKQILLREAAKTTTLTGASVGTYDTLIKHVIQMGLAFAPQGLAHHRENECKDGDQCGINEDTCVAIPACDMMVDIVATAIASMPLDASATVIRNFLELSIKARQQYIERLKEEDPETFRKSLESSGLPQSLQDAIANGEANPGGNGPRIGVLGGDEAVALLKRAFESGSVPEEHRERISELLGKLEAADGGSDKPENASDKSTFVQGDTTKKTKH